ncbi:hypothetical protein BDV96DRAFT_235818 [Lophiotrema nucula]|uniref:C2H2-type domain-containing protein n=1 Tax=Lophiotrema nucula TaxID=690887 RepID=A0A6A5YQB3_9PLEO|nr:hypothetical protein BDV96DRAFT_235818 [Lophiotrema nucula]
MNTMPSVDSRPQAFNGQRPQQRRPEEDVNNFLPVSSGPILLQDGFTFSAEPAMIDYSSMSSLAPNSSDTVFTPNTAYTGSSIDSHLQYSSYPPAQIPMNAQNIYSLSPGQHSRNGQSISPSHSVDHFSPDAGYTSDPNYQDLSSFAPTPNYNGPYHLNEDFSNLNFGDNNGSSFNHFTLPITTETLNTFEAQAQISGYGPHPSSSQLMSPCPTNNSSPMIPDDSQRAMHVAQMQYNPADMQSTPPQPKTQTAHSTPRKQQHSPALTNSPSGATLANPQPRPNHLQSPIVYITGDDASDISRPMSKRSHGSHKSKTHLSPYHNEESSDEEEPQQQQVRVQPVVRSAQRDDEGNWLPSAGSGQVGLSPDDRQAMNDAWVPTLDEITEQRLKDEKKLEVHSWLAKSEVGSEAGDGGSSNNFLKPLATRPRAKSTNDAHRYGLGVRTDFLRPDDSGIPGPGVYIDERSEYDDYEDDDESAVPESPPAAIDMNGGQADDSDYPPAIEGEASTTVAIRPWNDGPVAVSEEHRYQPPTSNAAIMRFRTRARDVESASLAATLGSRRLSESDLGSIRAAPGVIKALEPPDLKKSKERQRRPSFLESILPKRTPSNNVLKRQRSIPVQQPVETTLEKMKDPMPEKPRRMGSWGRPKSPRLDTSVANHSMVGPPNPANLSATSGPWLQRAGAAIRRSRSRSDLGKSPGLAELMTQHGGPPMPTIATSPLAETEAMKLSPQPSHAGDDDDDDAQEAITMDLKVRSDPIIPTYEGFKTHARQLNPRLVDYMVERITQEQMRRYKRLLEFRVKHLNAVKNHNCASKDFCTELGGESKQLPPRAGNKDSDAPFIGFQITAPGSSDDEEQPTEGTVISAQFPSGVPLPPVKRLPAEFECPLCFKVKKFYKPSDWTKHVHEDVQPFTCTFPNCGEPKSFKRKADWVRHENERHRQLENWTCQIQDCNHTCYRKDNFVQHLVREHKIAEPRARTGRGNKDASGDTSGWQPGYGGKDDDIWTLVERCRRDTTKQPKDEPCRFCGNICNSWKKLTVHLAKHMEQISMPILPLVEQKQMNADTIISPVVEIPESRKITGTPSKSPVDNPSRYNPNANISAALDPSFGHLNQDTSGAVASNVMHTYPPPQMMYNNQQPVQKSNYANYVANNGGKIPGGTYPQVQDPSKARGVYVNGLQIPNQPYHNGNMQGGPNRFPMTPISAIGQGNQGFLTSSPVDTTPFSTDTLGANYFTQEPQNMSANGGMPDMGFDAYQTGQFHDMSYMPNQQQHYQFQGH